MKVSTKKKSLRGAAKAFFKKTSKCNQDAECVEKTANPETVVEEASSREISQISFLTSKMLLQNLPPEASHAWLVIPEKLPFFITFDTSFEQKSSLPQAHNWPF